MTTQRIALVTGANQGLGLALVEGLAAQMAPRDTGPAHRPRPGRVRTAAAEVAAGPAVARVEGRVLDVRDGDAIAALAAELGEVDIVFSNAAARMSPDADPADEVDAVAETNNLATTRILRAFAPRLRPGGRLIVVASALGTLDKLDDRVADRFARPPRTASTTSTRSSPTGAGPSTTAAPSRRASAAGSTSRPRSPRSRRCGPPRGSAAFADLAEDKLVMALCPGLIDTAASRPWFEDMSRAQSPAEAARWPVELALAGEFDAGFYGELVQFGRIVPWESGVPVPRTVTA